MNTLIYTCLHSVKRAQLVITSRKLCNAPRKYFYHLDTRGQVFLADTKHKNFVTSLKDKAFLNQLFRQLRRTPPNEIECIEYPAVSLCMGERNYLNIDDPVALVVFSSLKPDHTGRNALFFGGSDVCVPFDPLQLRIDEDSGRFYHAVTQHRHLTGGGEVVYGLLHSHISDALATDMRIHIHTHTHSDASSSNSSSSDSIGGSSGFVLRLKDGSEMHVPALRR